MGGGGVLILILLLALLPVFQVAVYSQQQGNQIGCARPSPAPTPPGLGGQEHAVRELRRRAFAGDFFAQVELGHRHDKGQYSTDQNLWDPVEAAVWYSIALANERGWSGIDRQPNGGPGTFSVSLLQLMIDRFTTHSYIMAGPGLPDPNGGSLSCRDFERLNAYGALEQLASNLTGPDREKVRDRVIYVLSTQGAPGYLTLSRMYDANYAYFGEPWTDPVARQVSVTNISSIFVRSDADAWLYNYIAAGTGDIEGYAALQTFETNHPDKAETLVAAANRWTPPFEFYPPEPPENKSGAEQYSDESRVNEGDGAEQIAMEAFTAVPFVHVGRALEFLQVVHGSPKTPRELDPHAVAAFHELIGESTTGPFTLLDAVRAIQLAAERGSDDAQLVLAVMYAEGIGVRADYARSLKWFEMAAHQGSPAAQFAVSTYFALGAEGVADQDKAQAVAARLASAVDGFHPSAERMRDLLAHICRTHHADKNERYRGHG
jgi:TPR repeat protein